MIKINTLSKSFNSQLALNNLTLAFPKEKTHVILGSSGSGKSTLIRILMGLTPFEKGDIYIDDITIPQQLSLTTHKRLSNKIGYVIQDGALFPHLTAWQNISLPAEIFKIDSTSITQRIEYLAKLVNLDSKTFHRYPKEFSGGQRQRIGLIRALILDPPILFLDEPLGALDPLVRSELQIELKDIFNRLNKTVLIVTHDIGEAAYFGHSITLLSKGALLQHGTLTDLIKSPASEFVTNFISAQRQPPELSVLA